MIKTAIPSTLHVHYTDLTKILHIFTAYLPEFARFMCKIMFISNNAHIPKHADVEQTVNRHHQLS